ncbi:acyl carrier protein [Xanthobacter autotrophicus]|jgi:acyl carrier protein|uniref:Acyl carrier protein n=1 Tax=Xanthobacter autotrophicus TaxID=280 RepID=A0A6C1K939_XANAU|nr:acyl carrier protein [Xanthobacter autotrophicus]
MKRDGKEVTLEHPDVYEKLTDVFRNVFQDDDIVLFPEMTAADVEGWDSLANIRLILAVETAFSIRLSAAQAASLAKLGDLVSLIASKI